MRKFEITGMSCSACSLRVEKAVKSLENIDTCNVSLVTNTMTVEGSATDKEIKDAVKKAGYNAYLPGENKNKSTQKGINRLVISVVLLLFLMYFSMGQSMFNLPLPYFLSNFSVIGLIQCIFALAIIITNIRFFTSGVKSLLHFAPNMDTLVSLGSGVAFVYSVYMLFIMYATGNGEILETLYFESSAMILTLVTVGKTMETYSKDKTADALNGLKKLKPETAVILTEDGEKEIPVSELKVNDVFILYAGDSIPADGVIISGTTAVNESAITGESLPSEKYEGDKVIAGTQNITGFIKCRAEKVGEDTLLSGIIQKVTEVTGSKAPISRVADKVASYFVPIVTLISVITFIIWIIIKGDLGFAVARAISVLVISCPCALGLATPVAITVGSGVAAKNGILFKNAAAIEICGKINAIALDKTGTITEGKPSVTDIITADGISENELLSLALSLENKSRHPLALAVTERAKQNGVKEIIISDFENKTGSGVIGKLNGKTVFAGNLRLAKIYADIDGKFKDLINEISNVGKTPMLFGEQNRLYGIIAVADKIRSDSKEAIDTLNKSGIITVLLTGDNENNAEFVAKSVGIKEYAASCLPNEKSEKIAKLKENYTTAMVGDGINDAVALTAADLGMAIGAGSDIALNSADVILLKNNLIDVYKAIKISRKVLKNIKENLFWAFFYNVLGIPVAAGLFIPFGLMLNPMIAAACMGASSICVVTNALRLNNILKNRKDKYMKILNVDGMMCEHCEARVKKALEALPAVLCAVADRETKTVKVTLTDNISDSILKSAVENEGYTVTGIE